MTQGVPAEAVGSFIVISKGNRRAKGVLRALCSDASVNFERPPLNMGEVVV
jgi:hypothetical protein